MVRKSFGIYFLDVGQGDCTFLVPPHGEADPILFDCADQVVAERFCADHEITGLEAVVVSHLDIDHIRGILPFLKGHFEEGRGLKKLIVGRDSVRTKEVAATALLEATAKWEKEPPVRGLSVEPPFRTNAGPSTVASGPGWSVSIVLPFYGQRERDMGKTTPNACSAVLRVEAFGTTILVGGDANLSGFQRLAAKAHIIRAPHHGGDALDVAGTYSDLYDPIEASVGIISVGTGNGYRHPLPLHVEGLRRTGGCRVLCTQMTPQCSPTPSDFREEARRNLVEYPYRAERLDEVPCAGTVVVSIEEGGECRVTPRADDWHDSLVGKLASPLCRR